MIAAALLLSLLALSPRAAAFPAYVFSNGTVSLQSAFGGDVELSPAPGGARPACNYITRFLSIPLPSFRQAPSQPARCWTRAAAFC